ncbi:MAG: hypothetical protein P8170_18915 [Gemmatimonadota bacterium]
MEERPRVAPVVCVELRVGVHVHQPGSDQKARHVERVPGLESGGFGVPEEGDPVACDGQVRHDLLRPSTVEDGPTDQEEVGHGGLIRSAGCAQHRQDEECVPEAEHGYSFGGASRAAPPSR